MNNRLQDEGKKLAVFTAVFLACYFLPAGQPRFDRAIMEALQLVKWYAREHVILCLLPAFFIAGAIAVFISQNAVLKYLGPKANKVSAYGVAAVSGTILAVCSCTVLPLFAGIYKKGAGLGPAAAFLYSGPAINVLAIVLTANVLGWKLGLARAVGAVLFSIIIGLLMQWIFRREDAERTSGGSFSGAGEADRPLWQTSLYFAAMICVLVFANWGRPESSQGLWHAIFTAKWIITAVFGLLFAAVLITWWQLSWVKVTAVSIAVTLAALIWPEHPSIAFGLGVAGLSVLTAGREDENGEWFAQSWGFAKQILPLLFWGVLIAGLLLGRPDQEGLIPSEWVSRLVGGNSLKANFFASFMGAFMYFATLTEVPILQGLTGNGMGQGPALTLLLAGPALSLPNMLVIRSVLGAKKTFVFVSLVIVMAAGTGWLYGWLAA